MNFMEFVCRGVVRNEDNIRRLSKNVAKLTKCTRNTNVAVTCVFLSGLMLAGAIYVNAKDIAALQKQVKDLTHEVEELKEQKGA